MRGRRRKGSDGYWGYNGYTLYTDCKKRYRSQPEPNSVKAIKTKQIDSIAFFKWLYNPSDMFTNINVLLRYAESIHIPEFLIIVKYIKHHQLNNVTDEAELINLIANNIFGLLYDVHDLQNMILYASSITHELHDDNIIAEINVFSDKFKQLPKYAINYHASYPIPDPEYGRPRLEWNECYHAHCHKRFASATELVYHLKENDSFVSGMHEAHEEAVRRYDLDKQKILSGNYTRCPSFICSKGTIDMTPEELIYHFTMLGITPFWEKGMNLMPDENIEENANGKLTQLSGKMYTMESVENVKCAICCDNEIQVIFLPCFHYYVCLNCSRAIGSDCPICRKQITHKLPY